MVLSYGKGRQERLQDVPEYANLIRDLPVLKAKKAILLTQIALNNNHLPPIKTLFYTGFQRFFKHSPDFQWFI